MQEHEKQDTDPVIRPDKLLADWLVAVATFYQHYHQLSCWIDSHTLSQTACFEPAWIGQCSTCQLTNLQHTMRCELEKLNLDMERTDRQSLPGRYETLTTHTRRLEELSHQANRLLQLAQLPAS